MARRSLKMSAACHGVGARRRSLLAGGGVFTRVPMGPEEAVAGEGGEGGPRRSESARVPLLRHELQQQLLELERGAASPNPHPHPHPHPHPKTSP
jgi:hypothetical protein